MKYGIINFLICFVISMVFAPIVIRYLRKLKFGQSILVYVESHQSKSGTPTMGGIIFIIPAIIGYFVFWNKNNILATVAILSFIFFAVVGFLDDYIKIKFKQNEGLKPYQKIIGQLGIAIVIAVFVYGSGLVGSEVIIPFTDKYIDIGFWIIPFVVFVYLAIVNSVNLIDGLDGLCGSVSSIVLASISIILFVIAGDRNTIFASELTSMAITSMGLVGGVLGFLFFNSHPARCFMGDAGSLALGGYIASVFILSKEYLLAVLLGLPFVITAVSVIMQVGHYKLTKKRIFKMAPLHHHFEMIYGEAKVVASYIIFTIIICAMVILFYV